ncbi:MAG: hypothetical protein UW79_C0005G0050 [Candidatus Yanofskybacteria bacterium GW2011_GWA2_44_9]|uniref:Uncharacterized protein n=1 Tax=Candidatus Yanofskybacteria bacterium GW2011_GWA2_44_9 TaxID=1619025 RepID=A0A0G1KG83_9BACT|nr:MAG: hypothetical protein UW79_C0005G0050 [Candidatus Yanofskybacteria bacterium GW2011_GWA2_44_9]
MVITGAPRKRLALKGARGFESHPHRLRSAEADLWRDAVRRVCEGDIAIGVTFIV